MTMGVSMVSTQHRENLRKFDLREGRACPGPLRAQLKAVELHLGLII